MSELEGARTLVTGGSRGIGLGIVEALVDAGAAATILARGPGSLEAVAARLGVGTIQGDVTDPELADRVIGELRPEVLVLNAGIRMPMAAIDEVTWDAFDAPWQHDVKAGLHWLQASLRHRLRGRVLMMSSGAAVGGSPLSGGYAGAKRMLWLMADYAHARAAELDLDLRVQTLVPTQIMGGTGIGDDAAAAYAAKKGVSEEAFLAGFGAPMTPRQLGDHIVTVLTDPGCDAPRAFTMRGSTGLRPAP